jgi:hypothetical protein
MAGKTCFTPMIEDRVLKAWRQSVTNGTPYEEEERHRGVDRTYRWFWRAASRSAMNTESS